MDQKVKRVNDHLNELLAQNRQQVAHTNLLYVRIRSTSNQMIFLAQFQIWGARVGSKWEPASVTFSHFLSHERCPALQTIVGTEALLVSAWRSLESLDKTKIQVGLVSFP